MLDVSGLGRLLGDPTAIGAELLRACRATGDGGAAAGSVAVAPTQIGALLLASASPGLTVVEDDLASALAPIPIRVLRQLLAEMYGVTVRRSTRDAAHARQVALWKPYETAFRVLEGWGLTTLGELAALPGADLSARLGQLGVELREQARGRDLAPLAPDPDVPRFVERIELEWPIDALEPLSFVLARLLDPLSAALERADRAAAALRLDLRLVDRTTHGRLLQLPAAIRDPRVLRTLLLLDLESHPPAAAIDVVTIEIDPAPGRVVQYSLLTRARPSAETLATLTARLSALVGGSRSGTPVLLDTWQPDAFEMRRFAPDSTAVGRSMRAEPAGSNLTCVRRFRPSVAIRVRVEQGRPVWVAIDRKGMPGGHVEQAAGPWRSSGAWWELAARAWNRDEWDVALSGGAVCRLFRDRGSGAWFMDGVID